VNDEAQAEDLTILAAVEALERGIDLPGGAARPDEASETLARLYAEVLGLVPYELAPVAPAAGVKARLMATVSGDETQPAAVEPRPAPVVPPAVLPRPTHEARPPHMAAVAASRPPRRRGWPLALAATLALALLGLSFWLYSQLGAQRAVLGSQRATIAGLRQELALERARSEGAVAKVRQLETDTLDLHQKFALVTSPAVLVSPMRPVGRPAPQPNARGVLFVAADHQHWYMALQGLQPVAPGKAYKLWFISNAGAVDAGSFSARPGAAIELSSQHMAAGTRGVLVTLEDDARATAPTGPPILRAAAVYTIS
jgi:hypothetical protein